MHPKSLQTLISRNSTVAIFAINNTVKTSRGLDPQYTLEEKLHKIDANLIFNTEEQPLDPVALNQ